MAYLAPAEFVTKMVDAGESKLLMSTRDTLIRSYMAGAILALAAAFAIFPGDTHSAIKPESAGPTARQKRFFPFRRIIIVFHFAGVAPFLGSDQCVRVLLAAVAIQHMDVPRLNVRP